MIEFVRTHCLTVARFCLSAWVGAAALFVINGIRLVTSPDFDSVARDQMAHIRFPTYYLFGFVAVGLAWICLNSTQRFPQRTLAIALVSLALVIMGIDYFVIYRPLEAMITPPGQTRPADFARYHQLSETINTVHVGICLIAAIVVSRPRHREREV